MCFKWHRSIRQHDNGPWKTYMTCLTCSRAKTSGLHLGRLRQRRCERQKRLTNWQALGKHSQGMANRQFSFHPATELQFSLIDCQVWLVKSSFNQVCAPPCSTCFIDVYCLVHPVLLIQSRNFFSFLGKLPGVQNRMTNMPLPNVTMICHDRQKLPDACILPKPLHFLKELQVGAIIPASISGCVSWAMPRVATLNTQYIQYTVDSWNPMIII